MRKKWQPPTQGEFRIRPGRRVIWLARPSSLSVGITAVGLVAILLGLVAAGVPVVPMVWYALRPSTVSDLANVLNKPVMTQTSDLRRQEDTWQPPVDPSLPKGEWLAIPSIKVKTEITEAAAAKYEDALRVGVWRVPDLGTPDNRTKPLILVAHRYGYLKWSNTYRMLHSFYNLPKVTVGDKVAVVWQQREYVYEIYAGDEGKEISDYSADLILYTCKYLQSDQRIFKYARLVKQ